MKLTSKRQIQFWFSWDDDSEQRKTLTNKGMDIKTIKNTSSKINLFFFSTLRKGTIKTLLEMIKIDEWMEDGHDYTYAFRR